MNSEAKTFRHCRTFGLIATCWRKAVPKVSAVLSGVCALLLALTTAPAQAPETEAPALRTRALKVLAPLPDKMPGSEHDCAEIVALGKKLYFEKKLSRNQSQSCSSCHPLQHCGVDNQPTSPGALGKRGARNSPTTLNAGFQFVQFWDGRATNLQQQAGGPLLNPVEMAMFNEAAVVKRLKEDPAYPAQFGKAFPGQNDPVTFANTTFAIAAFERTLISHDRLDDFLKGNDRALTPREAKGLNTFLTVGCTACHNGALLGGNAYQKVGLVKPYPNQTDIGRAAITGDDGDKLKFKVPTLRNIAETAPYFHDGSLASLHETVRTMANLQLGLDLTTEQEADLVAFLGCLTGKELEFHSASAAQREASLRK